MYFAFEALGLVDALHRKVFAAVHVQRQRFDKDAEIAAWVSANGADGAKVVETMKSFAVATKTRQANNWPRPTASTACRRWHPRPLPDLAVDRRLAGARAADASQLIQLSKKS